MSSWSPMPGTYWYHSHVGTQADRGLYGPLIIEDPNEKADYDDELAAFRVAVPNTELTVIATDGYPVVPVQVSSVILGMGERFDAISPSTGRCRWSPCRKARRTTPS